MEKTCDRANLNLCGFYALYCVKCYPILRLLFHLHFRKKSFRTITFDEFKVALGELARKKYKDKTGQEAEAEVFKLIEGKAPIIAGVTVRLKTRMTLMSLQITSCPLYHQSRNKLKYRANFLTESRGLPDSEPPYGHHQVYRVTQRAF